MNRLLLILVFVLPFLSFAQDEKKEEYLDWSSSRRLIWKDFEGPANKNSDAAASTSTYLGLEYNVRNNSFSYRIACRFSKTKSWGLVKNDWILTHEQGHFDVTEIFARLLHKTLGEYKFKRSTYQADVSKLYKEIMKQKEELQELYDTETDYSRNRDKQKEWLKKIESMLEETKAYAEYK